VFLRSLTIRGFKSFAEKTALEFAPGISVIVGPNGSGKSNIVDAIAWVLGEQGPRALRGGQMADVIFAGSPSRPALGMAEVRLVIDNSAGLIPIHASEIEITRSLFRTGDSEYRLGGRPCRLLDIQELLSDSGLGRALHAIVSQGHLEDVLSARPEERRQYVEEAAGIAKHRRRRERAERKLAGLEQDLLRLQDVVAELRRQLKPLKQQAELARRHEALIGEAADLARKLAAARLRALYQDRDRRGPAWQEAEARRQHIRQRLAALDGEIAKLDAARTEAESRVRRAEQLQTEALRAKSEAEDRLREAMRQEASARQRLTAATGKSGRLFALEEELERTRRALDGVSSTLEQREAELEEAEDEFRRNERARRAAEDAQRRAEAEAAARRANAENLRRILSGHQAEQGRLIEELRHVHQRVGALASREEGLEAEIERLDALETPLAREQAELARVRTRLTASLSELDVRERGLVARQEVVEARQRELAESPGAAFLRRRLSRDGHHPMGLLRELLGAPPHLRSAVRGALGAFADSVVYERRDQAVADAAWEPAGGVTLAIASSTSAAAAPPSARLLAPPLPAERRLIDLIRPNDRVATLAAALLGDVYLVANLAEAAAKHRVHPSVQFVTPEGAVVGPCFVRVAAGRDGRAERNRREAASIERDLAGVRRELREERQQLAAVSSRAEKVEEELSETDGLITSAAEDMATVRAELAALRREEQLVAGRVAAVETAARSVADSLASTPDPAVATGPPALPPVPEAPIHLRVEVEALRRERKRLDAGVARARWERAMLASEDPRSLGEALKAAEAERSAAEELLRNAEGNLAGAMAARRAVGDVADAARARHTEAYRTWREEAARAERVRAEDEEGDRARQDLERRIGDAERLLREGHGADPAQAVGELTEEQSVEGLTRQADLVARRLGLLGKVNLLAGGELQPLQERHDFLVRELEDVKAARRDLREVIRDVDRRMAELFDVAFRDISKEFSALFGDLFPGGEGRLELTDPSDPLGSGIEVEARPGRKRVRRLSLLSGGERSLSALAFLVAIFRARPSPFYLLDEVEAALDDVNLHRFLEVVKGLGEASQVLIVTHQKRTMEMADVLYGISMGQDGASTIISQRLAEVAAR
jgi:chromosome segregation protein